MEGEEFMSERTESYLKFKSLLSEGLQLGTNVDLCKEICSINHSDNRDVKHEDVLAQSFLFNSVVDFNPLEPSACFITCPSRSSINRELPKRNK